MTPLDLVTPRWLSSFSLDRMPQVMVEDPTQTVANTTNNFLQAPKILIPRVPDSIAKKQARCMKNHAPGAQGLLSRTWIRQGGPRDMRIVSPVEGGPRLRGGVTKTSAAAVAAAVAVARRQRCGSGDAAAAPRRWRRGRSGLCRPPPGAVAVARR